MRLINADGSFTINASDNTGYSLAFGGGIISCIDELGHIEAEFFADDIPTVDVAPVVYGEWKPVRKGEWTSAYKCSVCDRHVVIAESDFCDSAVKIVQQYPYCHCGAKMRKEGKE